MSRITDSGAGYVASYYSTFLPENNQTIVHAAKREWAEKNTDAVKKFREAIAEAAQIVNGEPEKAFASIAKFTKQPLELVKATPPNRSEPVLKSEQLAWWIEVMSSQKMLQSKLDTATLVLN